jgi:hypothetical protein
MLIFQINMIILLFVKINTHNLYSSTIEGRTTFERIFNFRCVMFERKSFLLLKQFVFIIKIIFNNFLKIINKNSLSKSFLIIF